MASPFSFTCTCISAPAINILSMWIFLSKIRLCTFTPNASSLAATNVSFLKGAEPFKEKSYSETVSEGKWLKKDNRTFEKFSSPSRLWFVQFFTFSATVPGKRMGNKNSSSKMPATDRPVIFKILIAVRLIKIFTRQI